jgi:hypothetical protein
MTKTSNDRSSSVDAGDSLDLSKTALERRFLDRAGATFRVRTSLRAGTGSSSGGDCSVKTDK